jgi:hypothetical protein
MQGKGWLPGGTVTLTATDGSTQYDGGSVQVPDSGEWEHRFTVGDVPPGDYEMVFKEDLDGCELVVTQLFTIEASSADTEPPTVSWVKPAGNGQYYPTASGTVELEVAVTDNVGIELVELWRLDGGNQEWIGITTFSSPPYQASIAVDTLSLKWNQMFARVKDTAGNYAAESIFIYRLNPTISLDTIEGSRGTEVTATGSGWLPEDTVIISLGDPANEITQVIVDTEGNFKKKFPIPPNAVIGAQKVIATTANGFWGAEAAFQVVEAVDLSIDSVSPVQVLEGQDLVKDKATAIKVVIRKRGSGTVNNVSVRANIASYATTRFHVAEPSNMRPRSYELIADSTTYPLKFAANETTKTIYFFDDQFTPTGSTFKVTTTVDHFEAISESNENNNIKASEPVHVYDTKWSGPLHPNLEIHYFPVDWGNTDPATFDSFYEYSNEFIKGVFPIAEERFKASKTKDIYDTSPFRDTRLINKDDDPKRLSRNEFSAWIIASMSELRTLHPTVDRFVAVVPPRWFADHTTFGSEDNLGRNVHPGGLVDLFRMKDLLIVESHVGATRYALPNALPVTAHELGHSYGLNVECEEYDANCDGIGDRYGVDASPGLWVDKKIPIQPSTSRPILNFMGAWIGENWIHPRTYSKLLQDHK